MRVLLLFAIVSAALQGAAEELSDPREIIRRCVEQMKRIEHVRNSYTYKYLDETKNLDRSGRLKDTHSKMVETFYFAGKEYDRLLEKDGKPLSPSEEKRERDKLNRAAAEAAKLSDEQRETRQAKLDSKEEKQDEWLNYLPQAYDYELLPPVDLNGRPTYVLKATPKPDYRGRYSGFLTKIKCKLFVDKGDYTLAKVEANVLQRITIGLFLARLSEGTNVTFEQMRVNDEVWLPKSAFIHADARAIVKTLRVDERVSFSDYHKYQSESRIVAVNAK